MVRYGRRALARIGTLLVCVTAGCVFDDIDLSGRACPCGDGWRCRDEVCVPSGPDSACDEAAFAGALLCDGFEDEDLAPWTSTLEQNGGWLERIDDPTWRGEGALAAHNGAADGRADYVASLDPPITAGELHGRLYLRVPESVGAHGMNVLTVTESVDPYLGVILGFTSRNELYSWIGTAYDAGTTAVSAGGLIPREQWICLRYAVTISDTAGSVDLFIDDVLVATASGFDTHPAHGFDVIRAGIDLSSSERSDGVVILDDLALSRTPLSCD